MRATTIPNHHPAHHRSPHQLLPLHPLKSKLRPLPIHLPQPHSPHPLTYLHNPHPLHNLRSISRAPQQKNTLPSLPRHPNHHLLLQRCFSPDTAPTRLLATRHPRSQPPQLRPHKSLQPQPIPHTASLHSECLRDRQHKEHTHPTTQLYPPPQNPPMKSAFLKRRCPHPSGHHRHHTHEPLNPSRRHR